MNNVNIITSWAESLLAEKGYSLLLPPEIVLNTPWSNVIRLITLQGNFYLKQTPALLFLEPSTIQFLSDKCYMHMPLVVGINPSEYCFLMKDSGEPLCNYPKDSYQLDLLCKGIKQYCEIQFSAIIHINYFLSIGVPDWRLVNLTHLFQKLLLKKDFLLEDGIYQKELSQLEELISIVSIWCKQLSECNIPETLDHCDLHDGNILINSNGELTIIDWGETVITHPFFSLHHTLHDVAIQNSLMNSSESYNKLYASCFDIWKERHLQSKVSEAILLAKKLRPIYSALAYYRLQSANIEEFRSSKKLHGRVASYLRELF